MNKNLKNIPRTLNSQNIEKAISDYIELLNEIPPEIKSDDILSFIKDLKRKKLDNGPYPSISIFEAANRIMTDLTILYGVRDLLNNTLEKINFSEYKVELGNENKNEHDIMAKNDTQILIGEAFNVAGSFFYTKKSSAFKKLNDSKYKDTIKLLLYNSDGIHDGYKSKKGEDIILVPVHIFNI